MNRCLIRRKCQAIYQSIHCQTHSSTSSATACSDLISSPRARLPLAPDRKIARRRVYSCAFRARFTAIPLTSRRASSAEDSMARDRAGVRQFNPTHHLSPPKPLPFPRALSRRAATSILSDLSAHPLQSVAPSTLASCSEFPVSAFHRWLETKLSSAVHGTDLLDFPEPLLPIRPYLVSLFSNNLASVKISRSPMAIFTSLRSISVALVASGSNLVCCEVAVIIGGTLGSHGRLCIHIHCSALLVGRDDSKAGSASISTRPLSEPVPLFR